MTEEDRRARRAEPAFSTHFAGDPGAGESLHAPLEPQRGGAAPPSPSRPPGPGEDDISARLDRLRERADHGFPEAWVPEHPGDELGGELVRYETGRTGYGEQTIAVLKTPDGEERALWLLNTVLRDEFATQRPRPGELVLVRFLGKKESSSGSSYAAFRIVVDRGAQAPDWSAISDEAPAAPPPAPVREVLLEPEPDPDQRPPSVRPDDPDPVPF